MMERGGVRMPDWLAQLAGPGLFWLAATVILVVVNQISRTVGETSLW